MSFRGLFVFPIMKYGPKITINLNMKSTLPVGRFFYAGYMTRVGSGAKYRDPCPGRSQSGPARPGPVHGFESPSKRLNNFFLTGLSLYLIKSIVKKTSPFRSQG